MISLKLNKVEKNNFHVIHKDSVHRDISFFEKIRKTHQHSVKAVSSGLNIIFKLRIPAC